MRGVPPPSACLLSVSSQVDRSVTGLVAQQPCVGPLGLPVADVGVCGVSYWGRQGVASALGEAPNLAPLGIQVGGTWEVEGDMAKPRAAWQRLVGGPPLMACFQAGTTTPVCGARYWH